MRTVKPKEVTAGGSFAFFLHSEHTGILQQLSVTLLHKRNCKRSKKATAKAAQMYVMNSQKEKAKKSTKYIEAAEFVKAKKQVRYNRKYVITEYGITGVLYEFVRTFCWYRPLGYVIFEGTL